MHLRTYLSILRRYWMLVLALPILVGILSLVAQVRQPARYGCTARLMITQAPHSGEQVGTFPDFNMVSSWQSSEFIIDDMPQVISSMALAQDISQWLATQGVDVPPATVQAGLSAQTFHRSVTISSQADSPELAVQFIDGAIASLQANGLTYWNRPALNGTGLSVAVLNPPGQASALRTSRQILRAVGLRVALALVAGIGLAFLLHYLDDRIRDSSQVEEVLGLPVVGVIPKE